MPSPNTYWRGIFDQYDRDKDGKISYAELKAIIESREYSHEFSKADVEKIMGLADTDNSGYIEYQEFIDMMHNPDLKEVFGHYVARYVNFIIPQIRPPLTGPWTGFQPVSTADGAFPIGRSRSVFKYSSGSYQAEYSCWPPAFFMILVSVVEVALFLYDVAQGSPAATGPVATLFIFNPHKRHEAWRFITCMLVHVGIIHLLVNVLVQLFLGVPLEMVHRWWRVALVYLAGVAAGSLAISVADPTSSLAGASGGVFALIAAHVATIIMNWSQIKHAIFHLLVFVVLGALSLAMAVYDRLHNRNENVSYVTHLAGAVAGLLVGIVVLRNLVTLKWEKKLWWAAFILYFSLMLAGILANIFWTKRFAKPD